MAKIIELGKGEVQHARIEIERPAHAIINEIKVGDVLANEIPQLIKDLKGILVTTTVETRGDELDICNRVPLLAASEVMTMGDGYTGITFESSSSPAVEAVEQVGEIGDENYVAPVEAQEEQLLLKNFTISLGLKVSATEENFDLEQEEKFIHALYNLKESWNVVIRTMETEGYGRDILFYNRITIKKQTNKQMIVAAEKFLLAIFLDNNWLELDKASKELGDVTKVQKVDQVDLRLMNNDDEDETYKIIPSIDGIELAAIGRRNEFLFMDLQSLESYSIQTEEETQILHVTEREEV